MPPSKKIMGVRVELLGNYPKLPKNSTPTPTVGRVASCKANRVRVELSGHFLKLPNNSTLTLLG